jgi:tRNA threonylcarbamoyladenosine biosynthesis protein TsaB
MTRILYIETGTNVCSVAIADDNSIIGIRESNDEKAHATQLTVFIDQLLKETGTSIQQIDAVTVSKGPGSYTGLRIGVSAAKGICFAAEKPLLAVSSLDSMAWGLKSLQKTFLETNKIDLVCPMIDARRMEVYTALYNQELDRIKPIEALVVNEESFKDQLSKHKTLFFGNGAAKCKALLNHSNAFFIEDFYPSAQFMIPLALEYFSTQHFENVAYFEPYYLKDFVATTSSKNLIPGLK